MEMGTIVNKSLEVEVMSRRGNWCEFWKTNRWKINDNLIGMVLSTLSIVCFLAFLTLVLLGRY